MRVAAAQRRATFSSRALLRPGASGVLEHVPRCSCRSGSGSAYLEFFGSTARHASGPGHFDRPRWRSGTNIGWMRLATPRRRTRRRSSPTCDRMDSALRRTAGGVAGRRAGLDDAGRGLSRADSCAGRLAALQRFGRARSACAACRRAAAWSRSAFCRRGSPSNGTGGALLSSPAGPRSTSRRWSILSALGRVPRRIFAIADCACGLALE